MIKDRILTKEEMEQEFVGLPNYLNIRRIYFKRFATIKVRFIPSIQLPNKFHLIHNVVKKSSMGTSFLHTYTVHKCDELFLFLGILP